MGTIASKLQYLANAVDDIQLAINEKGVTCDDSIELGKYGEKIRQISTNLGNGYPDFYELELITGITFSDYDFKIYEMFDYDYDAYNPYHVINIPSNIVNMLNYCDVINVTSNYNY